jgi:LDH2 family malate/lactate/ureidoglycolate dehydrogenase
MSETKHVRAKLLRDSFYLVLDKYNVDKRVAQFLVNGLIQTSLRGVDSHGIRLFPHYIRALKAGRINGKPNYQFNQTASSVGIFDADHTFGHASGAEAMLKAVEIARETGIAAVGVKNSSHFGAASCYGLLAAQQEMIGISMTHADSLMASHNSPKAFFGTNPICVTAPIEGEEPFCLDMATTHITWNKVKMFREKKKTFEVAYGIDKDGRLGFEPKDYAALLPIGGYKGFGLGMVVDILCGLLTTMPVGQEISSMYTSPIEEKRLLGHFFIAMDVDRFTSLENFKKRMKQMVDVLRSQPSLGSESVMVPGDPEKKKCDVRNKKGIPLSSKTVEEIQQTLLNAGLNSVF